MKEKLKELKRHGKAICNNTFLFPDGTIKAGKDCSFSEKLTAVYFYKFIDNMVYKL